MVVTILLYTTVYPLVPARHIQQECKSPVNCREVCHRELLMSKDVFSAKCTFFHEGKKVETFEMIFSETHRQRGCKKYEVKECGKR